MNIRNGLLAGLCAGILLTNAAPVAATYAELLLAVCAIGLFLTIEQSRADRQIKALQDFVTVMADQFASQTAPPPQSRLTATRDSAELYGSGSRLFDSPPVPLPIGAMAEFPHEVLPQRLRHHLSRIVGDRNPITQPANHKRVRELIAQHFEDSGWNAHTEPFVAPHGLGYNIVAERPGTEKNSEVIIVGAHYDTVSETPGANDNGVAVAGVMALAEMLADTDVRKTIRLVAWDLEEQQGRGRCCLGSRAMALACRKRGEKITAVFNLEMIGTCNPSTGSQKLIPGLKYAAPNVFRYLEDRDYRGDFAAVVGNPLSRNLMSEYCAAASKLELPSIHLEYSGLVRLIRDLRRSDHAPFWDAGYPAIMITDTADFRTSMYHTAMDRPEMIDFDFAARIVRSVSNAITQPQPFRPEPSEPKMAVACHGRQTT